jgi:class 3 adenylate cyclase/tetratricopeptide (TPR) repeat protein
MAGRVSSPRLIGRDEQLARLRDGLADAREGRARIILVAGDAGVGKTRLIAEFLASIDPAETVLLVGGCLALRDGGLPYAPITEALRRLVRTWDPEDLDRALGPGRSQLARLLPALGGTSPSEAEVPAGQVADQARLFELILGLVDRLGQRGPVVLVVEDLHWVDDATRDLLTWLGRNLRGERALLVLTYRADAAERDVATEPWLVELGRSTTADRIELAALTPSQVAEQLEAILGAPPAARLAAQIATRSGGNALFVEELIAAGMGESGARPRLPPTLRGMLTARVRGLEPGTTAVLRALAIAGREVDDDLLVAVTASDPEMVPAAIHDAIDRHLVVTDPETRTVALRHVLLQEAIVADLLAGERRTLHAAFAAALEAHPELADPSPAGAAAELAHHWAEADRPVEAFRAALVAADAATEVRAHSEAARHRIRAIDLRPRLPDDVRAAGPDEIDLILAAGESADLAGDRATTMELLERGRAIVDESTDPMRAGILEGRLGYQCWLAGQTEDSLAHHRRAVELVPSRPPTLARARVIRGLGGALMGIGRYRESIAVCEAAIEAARAAAEPIEEGRALDMLGMDRFGIGEIDAGIEALRSACALARVHDRGGGLIVALHNLAYHLGLADRHLEALAAAEEGIEVAREAGLDRRYGMSLRAAAADVLWRLGRWDEAEARVAEGRALDPDGEGSLYVLIVAVRVATARGRLDDGRALLSLGERKAAGGVDFDLSAYLHTAAAELWIWSDRPELASVSVATGLQALEGSDDVFLTGPLAALGARAAADRVETARAWHDESAVEAADAEATAMEARLDELVARGESGPPATLGFQAAVRSGRLEIARARGEHDAAGWSALAATWDGLAMPAPGAYARLRAAEALLAGGFERGTEGRDRRALADEELRRAATVAAELGARPLEESIRALARRARIDLGVASAPTPTGRPFGPGSPAAPRSSPARRAVPAPSETARTWSGETMATATPQPTTDGGRRRLLELGLSERELEVLELVAAGRSNTEVARVLFISPKTASVHVSHILAKLGVANRVEAATLAARVGLVDGGASTAETPPRAVTRAFLFTDIVGSTALIEVIGDAAWADLRRWHDGALRKRFAEHGGVEIDHAGDGFFVAFPSTAPAIACAVAIQRTLADHRRITGFAPGVRIGVHAGEATRTSSGWTGREVHLAARIAAHAGAGEILATTSTLASAGVRPAGVPVEIDLPGIVGPVEIASVAWG